MTDEAPKDWDHLAWLGETADQFQAFRTYLGLTPPRRLENLLLWYPDLSLVTIRAWSSRFHWRDRALAYEKHRAAELGAEIDALWAEEKQAVAARHVEAIRSALELARKELLKWHAQSDNSRLPVSRSLHEVTRLLKEAVLAERLVRGEATERVSVGEVDLSALTDEEFAEYERLIATAQTRRTSDAKADEG